MLFLVQWHLYGRALRQPSSEEMSWETWDLAAVPSELAHRLATALRGQGSEWQYDEPSVLMDIRITRVERGAEIWPLFGGFEPDPEDVVMWPEGRWTIAPEGGQP